MCAAAFPPAFKTLLLLPSPAKPANATGNCLCGLPTCSTDMRLGWPYWLEG